MSAATCRMRKVSCDQCGCIGRFSRAALARSGVPFCGCGAGRMTVDDLAIAVEVLPPEQLAEHPAYCATRAAEVESAIRSNRRVDTGRLVCGGCHAYISATNHRCRCGFWNDIRSGRNLGRWVEGSSSCKEWETEQEMPF